MAGIGFRLEKLLSGDSYTDLIKAYLFSAILAAGPMLIVILMLTLVHFLGRGFMSPEESSSFMGLVIYAYAFSMLGSGGLLYLVTRYLADHYFKNNFKVFTPTYLSSLEVLFLLQSIPAVLFLQSLLSLSFHEKWIVYLLYLFLNGIWMAMIFLSAAKSYFWIVLAYLAGAAIGVVASYFLGNQSGFSGILAGFALGQGVIFGILTYRIFVEFGYTRSHQYDFLFYLKKHPYLFGVGLFFNLGIWVDKFIMWGSKLGQGMGEHIVAAPDYDTPMFIAYLCVVPSMAFFLIQMETSFARCYISYFKSIQNRHDWGTIQKNKEAILRVITENFQKFVIFQGIISGLVILLVYDIAEILQLNPYQLGIFRIGLLGTFLQIGFIMFLNIYFYFDFQKEAFWITFSFTIMSALFTYATLQIDYRAYGFGFTLACFLTLLLTFLLLDRRLKVLDYYTFMKQPILVPRFDLELDRKKKLPIAE